jgi:Flp pilus assembly pilin Flp
MQGETCMPSAFLKLYFRLLQLVTLDEGQDLVEYSLIIALVVIGAVAAVGTFASKLVGEFSYINTSFP